MRVIVLLGPPGAGKGTQAPVISTALGLPILASGQLLRDAVAAGTSLGRQADGYMRAGQLVPDETIVSVFLERLAAPDAAAGAILDGFPRTRAQAEALDRRLAEHGRAVEAAILIDVPVDDLIRRMADRRICEASGHVYNLASDPPRTPGVCDLDGSPLVQRPDDREETVRARMQEQLPPLEAVIDHYRRRGILRTVDGRAAADTVSAAILEHLAGPSASGS